jgi:hypothetical protein
MHLIDHHKCQTLYPKVSEDVILKMLGAVGAVCLWRGEIDSFVFRSIQVLLFTNFVSLIAHFYIILHQQFT